MFWLQLISAGTGSRLFLFRSKESRLGVGKRLGGDTAGTANRNRSNGYPTPNDIALSNKSTGKGGGKRWMLLLWCLSYEVTVTCWGPAFRKWLDICLPMGSSESIPYFAMLVCVAFSLPIKWSLFQPTSFFTFTISIHFLVPLVGRSVQVVVQDLAAHQGLIYNKHLENYIELSSNVTENFHIPLSPLH